MIPGKYNITIYRGATWSINITSKNAAGTLLNFAAEYINNPTSGAGSAKMQIRPIWPSDVEPPTDVALFELSTANGRITVVQDTITLTIAASDTATLDFSSGSYDLFLITGETVPVKDKLMYGTVTVVDGVTV